MGGNKTKAAQLLRLVQISVFKYQELFAPLAMACVEQFYSGTEAMVWGMGSVKGWIES